MCIRDRGTVNLDFADVKTILKDGGVAIMSTGFGEGENRVDVYKRQVQFIWQTGKIYHQQVTEAVKAAGEIPNLFVTDFIKDMAAAYAAADRCV